MRQYARIIVEGMDGSGKTTLAKKLCQIFPDSEYHRNEKGPREDLGQWWMEQLSWNPSRKVIIHDRFFYPELVYGPVLRGKISVDEGTIRYVSDFIRSYAFLIYCRPPIHTIRAGVMVEDQFPGIRENFNQLLSQYDKVMNAEVVAFDPDRWFLYNWEWDSDLKRLVAKLEEYLG